MSPLAVGLLVWALAATGISLGMILRLLVERRWPQ
jgi:hypothetical protein